MVKIFPPWLISGYQSDFLNAGLERDAKIQLPRARTSWLQRFTAREKQRERDRNEK